MGFVLLVSHSLQLPQRLRSGNLGDTSCYPIFTLPGRCHKSEAALHHPGKWFGSQHITRSQTGLPLLPHCTQGCPQEFAHRQADNPQVGLCCSFSMVNLNTIDLNYFSLLDKLESHPGVSTQETTLVTHQRFLTEL